MNAHYSEKHRGPLIIAEQCEKKSEDTGFRAASTNAEYFTFLIWTIK